VPDPEADIPVAPISSGMAKHQLLLLRRPNHDGAALRVSGEELARDYATASALSKGLKVDPLKLILFLVEFEHANPPLRRPLPRCHKYLKFEGKFLECQ
jgi:hypothetical protein